MDCQFKDNKVIVNKFLLYFINSAQQNLDLTQFSCHIGIAEKLFCQDSHSLPIFELANDSTKCLWLVITAFRVLTKKKNDDDDLKYAIYFKL